MGTSALNLSPFCPQDYQRWRLQQRQTPATPPPMETVAFDGETTHHREFKPWEVTHGPCRGKLDLFGVFL